MNSCLLQLLHMSRNTVHFINFSTLVTCGEKSFSTLIKLSDYILLLSIYFEPLGANDEYNICLKLVVLVSNTRLLAA